ncbi:unnamed protein product [Calicophoron daubneyi]|uniref:RRM domain-containing protein n=1 Tax=Calicophoron daubneyi TaxID=300641 RepID=A0AAV2T9D6_CALDB
MNGEIDIIPNTSLRKILDGPSPCDPNLSKLGVRMPTGENNDFKPPMTSSDCPDYSCHGGIPSSEGETICEGREYSRIEKNGEQMMSVAPSNACPTPPVSTQFAISFAPDVDACSEPLPVTDSVVSSGASALDGIVGGKLFSMSEHSSPFPVNIGGVKSAPESERLLNLPDKAECPQNSDLIAGYDIQSSKPSQTCVDVAITGNGLISHASQLNPQQRLPKMDHEACNMAELGGRLSQKSLQLFPPCEHEVSTTEADHDLSAVGLWGKAGCIGGTPDDLSFPYNGDLMPQLMSSCLTDQSAFDVGLNGNAQIAMTAAAAAAKRAITGGHQNSRISTSNRPNTWSTNVLTGLSTTTGPIGSNSWGVNGKVNMSPYSNSSSALSSGPSPNGASPTSWSQMLAHQQAQSKTSCHNVTNMLGNMSLSGGCALRSLNNPTSPPSANFNPIAVGRGSGGNGLANIYSMFPKRPQHRMMAHWQQQQQHHHPNFQQPAPVGRIPSGIAPGSMQQLNNVRMPNAGIDMPGVAITGASGDTVNPLNYSAAFNGGCSILQSLSSGNPGTGAGQLNIGSSGDSLVSSSNVSVSANENTSPLDTFKFGLDQQLMEVIKSFETSGIGSTSISAANTNNNSDGAALIGGLDDVVPGFGDTDQFTNLGNLNHLSVLNQANSASSAPGLGALNGSGGHGSNLASLSSCGGNSIFGPSGMNNPYSVFSSVPAREEGYSRKVFVGGLPPDIDEEEITTAFRRFGPLIVDWPHKTESKAYFPPKGYCFLLFQDERSVQSLINACIVDEGKYYWCVSSPTMKDKPVQIRPWHLSDSDFVMDGSQPLDPRKTIFVGGVPRPLRALELALIMDRLYGGVCYAGIDTDPELKYPKGAGRVAFSNQQSYIAAISARFVQLQHNEIDKRVEVKPYVLDNQMCDECQGARCGGKFAPFFCANVTCLQYYCEQCWVQIHSRHGREYHKPLVKEGAERPRPALYRW